MVDLVAIHKEKQNLCASVLLAPVVSWLTAISSYSFLHHWNSFCYSYILLQINHSNWSWYLGKYYCLAKMTEKTFRLSYPSPKSFAFSSPLSRLSCLYHISILFSDTNFSYFWRSNFSFGFWIHE